MERTPYQIVRTLENKVDPQPQTPRKAFEPVSHDHLPAPRIYSFTVARVAYDALEESTALGREVRILVRLGRAVECYRILLGGSATPFYLVRALEDNKFSAAFAWSDAPKWYRLLEDVRTEADAWLHWPFKLLEV